MSTKPTSTPWKFLASNYDFIISGLLGTPTDQANAAYIVRAVIAHEELVGSLKRAVLSCREQGYLPLWIADAEQAIAKAESR